jgi:hypothetical protein
MKKMHVLAIAATCGLLSVNVMSAPLDEYPSAVKPLKLSGFRIGASVLGGAKAQELRLALHDNKAVPMISQFGWQHEFRFAAGDNGMAAVVEIISLVGGFNQGLIIPSVNLPIGIRSASGYEIGAGPHLSLGRVNEGAKLSPGFIVAGGMSQKVGNLSIPVNFAFMQGRAQGESQSGYTLSLLTGFAF